MSTNTPQPTTTDILLTNILNALTGAPQLAMSWNYLTTTNELLYLILQAILGGGGGGGTVTSIGLIEPAEFNVTGSPVTTAGNITVSWTNRILNDFTAVPSVDFGNRTLRNNGNGVTVDWQNYQLKVGGVPIVDWSTGVLYETNFGLASVDFSNHFLFDASTVNSIEYDSRILDDAAGLVSINWSSRGLYDSLANLTVNYENLRLIDSAAMDAVTWNNRFLIDSSGNNSAGWDDRTLNDSLGNTIVDWNAGILYDSVFTGTASIDWINHLMYDQSSNQSIDYTARMLVNGVNPVVDWNTANTFTIKSGSSINNEDAGSAGLPSGGLPGTGFYGLGNTYMSDPNNWLPIKIGGTSYIVPAYTP